MVEIYGKQKEYKKFLKDICLKNKNPTKIEIVERIKITSQIKDDYGAMLSIF